ncbi:hypothetical protein [Hymenobacter terricola]|uniref:hypothetical protein n=1 Tax=Hymenobacter terricola TaxID=2819236 RepID=UPI001CF5E215|nr:hypothetical protein [Hymenobacter terricola]
MAIIRNLASMMLKGKIGDTTYYVAESRQLARQALNNSNYGATASRTDVQQARRVKWANLVNFYSGNKAWMKKAYENLPAGVSIFNRFMQLNIGSADVALTRQEAQAKAWVPASYRLTQGSLTPMVTSFQGEMPKTTMRGELAITAQTTVAQFSSALIAENTEFRAGDAIVFVAFSGVSANPGPQNALSPATYVYEELLLDTEDTSMMQVKYPNFNVDEGFLFNERGDGAVGAIFIHTRKSAGKLFVSTQKLVLNDLLQEELTEWRSSAQMAKAIASYGESTNVPLAPGGAVSGGSGNDSSTGGGSGSLE